MAEAWIAGLATLAVGAYTSNQKKHAAQNAANQAGQASALSRAQNQYQFEQTQKNLAPYMESGKGAQGLLDQLLGLGDQPADFSVLTNSPQYQFALNQGQQALDRDAAARGTLFSGAHTKDAMQFGQGLASQQFQNYFNNLSSLANRGQNAAVGEGNFGQNMVGLNAGLRQNAAQAQGNAGLYQAGVNSDLAKTIGNTAARINWGSLLANDQPQLAGNVNSGGTFNGATGQGTYTGPGAVTAPDGINALLKG